MSHRTHAYLTGVIFLIIAVLHVIRAGYGWQVSIGTVEIPVWVSWIVGIVAACLSYYSFTLRKKT